MPTATEAMVSAIMIIPAIERGLLVDIVDVLIVIFRFSERFSPAREPFLSSRDQRVLEINCS